MPWRHLYVWQSPEMVSKKADWQVESPSQCATHSSYVLKRAYAAAVPARAREIMRMGFIAGVFVGQFAQTRGERERSPQ